MGRSLSDHRTGRQPKVRSQAMIAMNERGGDGFHGGDKRLKNRRDRTNVRQNLKAERWDSV